MLCSDFLLGLMKEHPKKFKSSSKVKKSSNTNGLELPWICIKPKGDHDRPRAIPRALFDKTVQKQLSDVKLLRERGPSQNHRDSNVSSDENFGKATTPPDEIICIKIS